MVSKEGDHERGTYMMKRGYRPDPTVEHPSIGAICCHELPVGHTEIPRHISILTGQWPSRGGFLGAEFDAFQADDPKGALPDVSSGVTAARDAARLADLDILERTLRPRPASTGRRLAAPRDARPRARDDELGTAQGVRRLPGARRAFAPSTATRRSAAAAWPPGG